MAENKFSCVPGCAPTRETVCIDTNRVLDSCRDRDCFENARVYLSDFGNEVLEHTGSIRAKTAKIVYNGNFFLMIMRQMQYPLDFLCCYSI